jgi:hypothetical protein
LTDAPHPLSADLGERYEQLERRLEYVSESLKYALEASAGRRRSGGSVCVLQQSGAEHRSAASHVPPPPRSPSAPCTPIAQVAKDTKSLALERLIVWLIAAELAISLVSSGLLGDAARAVLE